MVCGQLSGLADLSDFTIAVETGGNGKVTITAQKTGLVSKINAGGAIPTAITCALTKCVKPAQFNQFGFIIS
jgi:hypothetical protein